MLQHSNLIQRAIRDSQGRFTGKYEIVQEETTPEALASGGVKVRLVLFCLIAIKCYIVLQFGGLI